MIIKCERCGKIVQIEGFDCYWRYETVKQMFDDYVRQGYYEKLPSEWFEELFRCNVCGTVWALAEPDFPIRGYLEQR